jgi:RNA polymerase sigma-32 factor
VPERKVVMDKIYDYQELQLYRKTIMQYSILSHEQEYLLAKRYQQGDQDAGQKIIHANLRFVVKVSRKYFNSGHSCLEIIQEGNLGLIKALTRFDPDRGIPFIYYAVWWVEATIKSFIHKSGKVHTGSLGHAKDLYSLDESIGNDDNDKNRWLDYLSDDTDLEKLYYDKERSKHVSSLFHHCFTFLTRREAFIIIQRFYADPPITLTKIALQLGVSKERVRQLQIRSMEKLKHVLECRESDIPEFGTPDSKPYKRQSLAELSHGAEYHA